MDILSVKPFQETLNAGMCGPASLKMILDYWGVLKTEDELAKLCNVEINSGTNDISIKNTAEGFGFNVEIKNNSSFEDIKYWLDKKIPLIIDWFTRGRKDYSDSEVADGHYSVVVGLDEEYIYLQDPEIGSLRKIKKSDFYKVWFDFTGEFINHWKEMIIRQIIVISPKK